MSDYAITRKVITRFFEQNFLDGGLPPIPVEYPNRIYSPPDNEPGAMWGRFSIRHGLKFATDVGTARSRAPGEATLQIFTPEDEGVNRSLELGDLVVDFMENVHLGLPNGIVRFRRISVRELLPDGGWAQALVVMPFDHDFYTAADGGVFIPYAP